MKKIIISIITSLIFIANISYACNININICERKIANSFTLIENSRPAAIYFDIKDDSAVKYVANSFAKDLENISGNSAKVSNDISKLNGEIVIIGSIGHSAIIDKLISEKKINVSAIKDKWDAYGQYVLTNPIKGVSKALVIVGSNRRGAVYGAYDISQKIGVSPWYYWADIPIVKKSNLYITSGARTDYPRVKYRGFFINDEEPALGNWAREKFGGINSKMYKHVFELMLRLKGNYLWPAMWGKAFNADDTYNYVLADEMGVILGTSHHEPLMRAQDEWHRIPKEERGNGHWNYATNGDALRKFWQGSIERMHSKPNKKHYESLITIGMRGDGDEPMSEGTAINLLETIVKDQRKIIENVSGKPASETPQMWALYKEVQDYYDHGMQVPDDVLLLFADDNWGQIRRLPTLNKDRKGGYGIYYHFDYVGGPRNYKWSNTIQIEKTWQQMNLARASGADRLWIVNVGDIKPVEYPLNFFMDMAWNPDAMTLDAMSQYPVKWAKSNFGEQNSSEIGKMLTEYSLLASRIKPELLSDETLLKDSYNGLYNTNTWPKLVKKEQEFSKKLDKKYHDAWYQILGYHIGATGNLYDLYHNVRLNKLYHKNNDVRANEASKKVEELFAKDRDFAHKYHTMLDGKWNHMMSQNYIGYTYWQQPEKHLKPETFTNNGTITDIDLSGLLIEKPANSDVIVFDAKNYTRKFDGKTLKWQNIPNLAIASLPQGKPQTKISDNIKLEYDFELKNAQNLELNIYLSPSLDVFSNKGLKFAVSIDNQEPKILSFDLIPHSKEWDEAMIHNGLVLKANYGNISAGKHTIKYYRISDNVLLKKLVLNMGGLENSHLGPSIAQ